MPTKPPLIKLDGHLRAIVSAVRKANASQSFDDFRRFHELLATYNIAQTALDTEAAIKELDYWGTRDEPFEISPELRYALIQFLQGKIKKKRGPKANPTSAAHIVAVHVRFKHRRTGIPIKQLAAEEAKRVGLTTAALNAVLYPRKRATRKRT